MRVEKSAKANYLRILWVSLLFVPLLLFSSTLKFDMDLLP